MMNWLGSLTSWLQSLSWIGDLTRDPDNLRVGLSVLLGAAAFLLSLAFYFLISGIASPLRKRIHSVQDEASARRRPKARSRGLLQSLGGFLLPKAESQRRRVETLLRHADFRSDGAVRIFYGLKIAAAVFSPLLTLVAFSIVNAGSVADALVFAAGGGAAAFLLPDFVLTRLARRRRDRLRRGLPDALDMLVVCSEAGLGLNAGIQRVASEIALTHPDLADELELVTLQTRAGMDNRSALKDLYERTGLEDVQALVATLLQSMRFGSSIADTLRIYSDELRDKRLQRAQEKAAKVPTLMLFPMVFCIMPSFLLVILGPAILGLMDTFSNLNLRS
jgi:tight adherence protein C